MEVEEVEMEQEMERSKLVKAQRRGRMEVG
jgi:hypothetical protein